MKKLIKSFVLACVLQAFGIVGYGQSVTVADLIRLTVLSHQEAAQFISTQRHFKVSKPVVKNGVTISQFSNEAYLLSELIIKGELRDKNNKVHPSINYDFKPPMYVNSIVSQLKALGYTLISKQSDAIKQVWVFDNGRYLVTIHAYGEPILPANVEIHGK
jgi:hypothetical protein